MTPVFDIPWRAKRREYLKEYRQKNKSKLNEYHKKYHHSKKKKNEEKVK